MFVKYLVVSISTVMVVIGACNVGLAAENVNGVNLYTEGPQLKKVDYLIDFAKEWGDLQVSRNAVEKLAIMKKFRESFLTHSCEFKVDRTHMILLGQFLKALFVFNERRFGAIDIHPLHGNGGAYERVDTLYFSWIVDDKIGEIILETSAIKHSDQLKFNYFKSL